MLAKQSHRHSPCLQGSNYGAQERLVNESQGPSTNPESSANSHVEFDLFKHVRLNIRNNLSKVKSSTPFNIRITLARIHVNILPYETVYSVMRFPPSGSHSLYLIIPLSEMYSIPLMAETFMDRLQWCRVA
jgi:hypothetical protein